jgi:hypothetical protein
MKIYLAAVYTSNFGKKSNIYTRLTDAEKWHRNNHPYILESYHYISKERYVEQIREDKQRVFLDSGAYSAYTKGVEIDIPEYCSYVKRNEDILVNDEGIYLFSVLDQIHFTDKIASAGGTYRNQIAMEALGVKPLPCFHYGEDEKALEYYIKNYSYITLGGMVPISTPQLCFWLDRIWSKYLTDGSGRPRVKVHGFGLTAVDLMVRYPWWSVDSSSWVQIAVHGNILLPDHGSIAISSDSPRTKEQNYHYDNFAPIHREYIKGFIESKGFEVERLRASAYSRWAFNFWAFQEINRRTIVENKTFKPEQPVLFA